MNRRNLLTGVLMAGAAGAAGGSGAAPQKPAGKPPADQPPAEKPAHDPNAVTADDLAVLDRITGRSRAADERAQMAPRVQAAREDLQVLRAAAPDAAPCGNGRFTPPARTCRCKKASSAAPKNTPTTRRRRRWRRWSDARRRSSNGASETVGAARSKRPTRGGFSRNWNREIRFTNVW